MNENKKKITFKRMKLVDLDDKTQCSQPNKDLNNELQNIMQAIIDQTGDKAGSIKKFKRIVKNLSCDQECIPISRKSITPPNKTKNRPPLIPEPDIKWETY